MITFTVLFCVLVLHPLLRQTLHCVERLQNRAGIRAPATDVVHLTTPGILIKGRNEPGYIERMYVIADLFAFVAENAVHSSIQVCFDEITQEAVQFYTSVSRTGQASPPEATGPHSKVASVFLHHNVCRDL